MVRLYSQKSIDNRSTVKPELTAEFDSILGRFSDALATVKVAAKALNPENLGPECLVLNNGIDALDRTYTELDLAILRLPAKRVRRITRNPNDANRVNRPSKSRHIK